MRRPLLLLAAFAAGPALAQSAAGLWRTEPADTGAYLHVRIAPCAGTDRLCGVVDEVIGPTEIDITGDVMIRDMVPDGPGAWSGGTIWAPHEYKTYRARRRFQGEGLPVEGCVLMICRGQTWTRLD